MVLEAVALRETVQRFPTDRSPRDVFLSMTQRGPYISQPGTKQRDRDLRIWDRADTNGKWKGCRSGIIKKEAALPWEITGKGTITYLDPDKGRVTLDAVKHFQAVLQGAHFGEGWQYFVKRVMREYYTQDFGAVVEVIGPGDADKALSGAPVGIAVLDSLRCFTTGNPEFPIIYYSSLDGKLHQMHKTRVMRLVDMPDTDERFYGAGECALSRYIATAAREHLMTRYVEQNLDDKPKPGVMVASNIAKTQVEAMLTEYRQRTMADELDEWGKTAWLYSIDPTAKAELTPVNFAVPPEKFSFLDYSNHDVNELALAFNTDKNEIWELTSGTLGSGQQSEIQAQKARGKVIADFTALIERRFNVSLLPDKDDPGSTAQLEFAFKAKDEAEEKARTENDQGLLDVATKMHAMADTFRPIEIRTMLADRSETFQQILTNEAGIVEAPDVNDVQRPVTPDVTAVDTGPQIEAPQQQAPQIPAQTTGKAYSATKAEFVALLSDLIRGGLADDMSRRRFGIAMRAHLRRLGQMAYEDGLAAGGVVGELDDGDTARIQDWLGEQSGYVTNFASTLYKDGLPVEDINNRAELWANKSLELIYQEGLKSADANGAYEWILGSAEQHCETCKRLTGQVHRLRGWYDKGLLPKRDKLDCKGFNCNCSLRRTDKPAQGRY